ncbi:MAG: hypothetical protein HQ523_08250 [Lentisphaerae bacterium]|nr:hypothetical protein [Lentisphaerota bacterium]
MPTHFTQQENMDGPLEAVLFNLYPATFLKWIWAVSLERLVQAHPDTLRQVEDAQLHGKAKIPKKGYLAILLLEVLENREMCRLFYESLPDKTQAALSLLVWQNEMPLPDAEEALGIKLADVNPDKREWYYDPFVLRQEQGFVCLTRDGDRSWGYRYARDSTPEKSNFQVCLPPALRRVLKPATPPPDDFELLPLDDMVDGAMRYTCAQRAVSDMKLVAEYIQQGHLKYTKSEKISRPCMRHIRDMTPGTEFFEKAPDKDLELLRTRLLVGAMAFAGAKARELLLASIEAAPVKSLFKVLMALPAFFAEELQDYLLGARRSWIDYDKDGVKRVAACFAELPGNRWVSFRNIERYHQLRDAAPSLFLDSPIGFDVRVSRTEDDWPDRVFITHRNEFALAVKPLLKGFGFFLAALGMAEIAYDVPHNDDYCRPQKPFLSPFDGLRGIRLTPLGEYVFGQRKTYNIESDEPRHAVVVLDHARLLATCHDIDPLTELALKQFMAALTPGHYHMTHKSLLGGCASRQELEARITLFRRVISDTPPPLWERFFESSLSRIAPLELEPDRVVLRIDSDEEIRHLFSSDPILRKHSLKVEGLRVAVLKGDMKIISKRLAHFGYLSPLASMRPKD